MICIPQSDPWRRLQSSNFAGHIIYSSDVKYSQKEDSGNGANGVPEANKVGGCSGGKGLEK